MPNRGRSVKSKLTALVLVTIVVVLGVVSTVLLAYEVYTYRQTTANSLSTIADVVAQNSAAVLIYDDRTLAVEILASLRAEPEIVAAALFDKEGQVYATYGEAAIVATIPEIEEANGVVLHWRHVTVVRPVTQAGTHVGTLLLHGDLRGTYERFAAYVLLLVSVLVIASFTAFLLWRFLERRVSGPLLALAETARAISLERNYAVRARRTSDDEFGQLTDAFNAMLDQIALGNAALREGEERFRTLADNMAQLAWMADRAGMILWMNQRWAEFAGANINLTQVDDLPLRVHHPEFRERVQARWRQAVAAGEPWEDTYPMRNAQGEYRWFLSHAIPIRDGHGQVLRWFGTHTDITELREVQQQLKLSRDEALAASRAKDEFLARLSHELRTPLSPVLLLVSDAERNRGLPDEVRADYEMIRKHVELEARLIDDLLDLTTIAHGKLKLQRTEVDARDVLRDALATVQPDIAAKSIALTVEVDPRPAPVFVDAARLQQVFWNILKNAVKFTAPRGAIRIVTRLEETSRRFVLEVHDKGIGIKPEELVRIFDAFVQGDHAQPRGPGTYGGLGLGLAISRMVIELHAGTIQATSDGPGRGATITVQLPLIDALNGPGMPVSTGDGSAPMNAGERPSRSALHILLVEDHEFTRMALCRILARRGYHVEAVGSLAAAREVARQRRVDLLISDIGLPDGTGYDLMMELRAKYGMRGIAMTGYGMESDIALARNAGFEGHLTKPVQVASLEALLNRLIASLPRSEPPGLSPTAAGST